MVLATVPLLVIWPAFFQLGTSSIWGPGSAGGSPGWIDFWVLSVIVTQVCVIASTVARGRHLGGGDPLLGLAAGPVQRPKLVVVLCVLNLAPLILALLLAPTLRDGLAQSDNRHLVAAAVRGPVPLAGLLFSIIILAPVSEELLFRGWLWTALRGSWGVWPAALSTGGVWLGLHAVHGGTALYLIPSAVILSIVRHACGSVRATIVIHVVRNAVVMIFGLAALLVN